MSVADKVFINPSGVKTLCVLLEAKRISLLDFGIGLSLCRCFGDLDTCSPSREEIGRLAGIARVPTVSAAISRLIDVGFIDRERMQHGARYRLRHANDGTLAVTSEETPVATVDAEPQPPPSEPPQTAGEVQGNAMNDRDIALGLVRRFRQKVRCRELDGSKTMAAALHRIREIINDGATEAELFMAIDNAATHFESVEERQRMSISEFFGQNGGEWKRFAES